MTADSIVTLESLESYFTARTQISRSGSVVGPGYFYHVAAYTPYGDQALSNRLLRLQARPRDPRELLQKNNVVRNGGGNTRLK
jgi:hypothetical protein